LDRRNNPALPSINLASTKGAGEPKKFVLVLATRSNELAAVMQTEGCECDQSALAKANGASEVEGEKSCQCELL
jgi:hypothetical protein